MSLLQKILLVAGMFVASVTVFLLGMFIWATIFTSGLKDPIEKQLLAIQMEDYATAYSYTSTTFQNVTSLDQFKKFINNYSVLRNNKSIKFHERQIEDGIGYVQAEVISRSGESRPINYRLIKQHGHWKIESIVIDPNNSKTNTSHAANTSNTQSNNTKNIPDQEVNLKNLYLNKRYNFSVFYPTNWVYTTPYEFETIFSNAGAENIIQVNVHAILLRERNGKYRDNQKYVNDVMTNLMSAGARNVTLEDKGPVPLIRASNLSAEYTMLRYTFNNQEYRAVIVLYFKSPTRALYALEFIASTKDFERYFTTVRGMAESFSY